MSRIELLLAVQEIDATVRKLKKELSDLPRRKADEEARLNDALKRQMALESAEERNQTACDAAAAEIADIRAFIAEIDERLAEVGGELEKTSAARAEAAAKVPPAQLRLYERLAISHHPTMVKLEGGKSQGYVCSGCRLAQPPSVAHKVTHLHKFDAEDNVDAMELVTCGMCGRILY